MGVWVREGGLRGGVLRVHKGLDGAVGGEADGGLVWVQVGVMGDAARLLGRAGVRVVVGVRGRARGGVAVCGEACCGAAGTWCCCYCDEGLGRLLLLLQRRADVWARGRW